MVAQEGSNVCDFSLIKIFYFTNWREYTINYSESKTFTSPPFFSALESHVEYDKVSNNNRPVWAF